MRVVREVDLLANEAEQVQVARLSLGIIFAGVVAAVVLALVGPRPASWLVFTIALIVGYLVSLPLHELTHAAAFKLIGRKAVGKITFGYTSGMLYAGCPGARLKRRGFIAVLLAPFVVLSLMYVAIGCFAQEPLLAWSLFALHASGCAGDFYMARIISVTKEADLCEDTENGIRLLCSSALPD